MHVRSCLLLALLLGCGLGLSANALYTVTFIDLGTLGGTTSVADVNNAGQVTGYSDTPAVYPNNPHAFLYSDGQMMDLGTLGGSFSFGSAINDAGQVTGYSSTSSGANHAFLYSNGQMIDLGALPGYAHSYGNGINNAGQVTGYSQTSSGMSFSLSRGFLYSDGRMTDLGALDGRDSIATDINNVGQVTGYSNPPGSIYPHAFLYSNGRMIDLGGPPYSLGRAINDVGQVVGESRPNPLSNEIRAFLYSNGQMMDLGTLGGIGITDAYAINNAGQVTGISTTASGRIHAFLYSNGQMTDLNNLIDPTLGVALSIGEDIDEHGQIFALGSAANGGGGLFLLTPVSESPVPEPGTWALLGLPLLALLIGRVARDQRSR